MHRRLRHLASRIAVLAMLVAALAPGVSRALGSGALAAVADVCRSEGGERAPATRHALAHCAYCGTQAPPLALPPAGDAPVAPARFAHERPTGAAPAAAAPPPWQLAVARAPPAVA